uniref:Large ribosomal subunit protein uL10m n=1 Tax=Meloidogyne hapla TaxID=6305 RepID=A0A1I8BGQ1_MELHA
MNFHLKQLNSFKFCYRQVSSYYVRPNPRPYKRRVYEAALAPIIPKELEEEFEQLKNPYNIYATSSPHKEVFSDNEFSMYELALIEKLNNWIKTEGFRLMAICHTNFVKEEVLWFAKNKFRLEGIEMCDHPSKILKKVFENSPYQNLSNFLIDGCTCLLFGKEAENIGVLFNQCSQYSWIIPIVVTFDEKILSLEQAKEIAEYGTLDNARTQTVLILNNLISQISNSLNSITCQLPRLLDAHLASKEDNKETSENSSDSTNSSIVA